MCHFKISIEINQRLNIITMKKLIKKKLILLLIFNYLAIEFRIIIYYYTDGATFGINFDS